MNRKPITRVRHIAATFCALALMAVALPAAANDQPLPVPEPANDITIIVPLTPEPKSPINGEVVDVDRNLYWTQIAAQKYTVKAKNLRTGETIAKTVDSAACNATTCAIKIMNLGLHTISRDGDAFIWRVVAKFGDGINYKSSKANAILNEIDAPELYYPANNEVIVVYQTQWFMWKKVHTAAKYQFVLRDVVTGDIVHKFTTTAPSFVCDTFCSYGVEIGLLPEFHLFRFYEWSVKAIGFSGEKAVSEKRLLRWTTN